MCWPFGKRRRVRSPKAGQHEQRLRRHQKLWDHSYISQTFLRCGFLSIWGLTIGSQDFVEWREERCLWYDFRVKSNELEPQWPAWACSAGQLSRGPIWFPQDQPSKLEQSSFPPPETSKLRWIHHCNSLARTLVWESVMEEGEGVGAEGVWTATEAERWFGKKLSRLVSPGSTQAQLLLIYF